MLVNRGQRRITEHGKRFIAETDQGHLFGDPYMPFFQDLQGADRTEVAGRKYSIRQNSTIQEIFHTFSSVLQLEVAFNDKLFIKGEPIILKGCLVSPQSFLVDIDLLNICKMCDPPTSLFHQMLYGVV